MQEFHPGFLSMMKGTAAPVVPVYLGRVGGACLVSRGGGFFGSGRGGCPIP